MNNFIFAFASLFLTIFASAQTPQSITVNGQQVQLYYVSPADLGYGGNTIAVTNEKLYGAALSQGYKLCTSEMAQQIYDNFSDGTNGSNWDGTKAISVCISHNSQVVTTAEIGKGRNGKYFEVRTEGGTTYQSFFDPSIKFMVFVR